MKFAALMFVCLAGTPPEECSFDTAVAWERAARACSAPGTVRIMRTSLRASYIKRVCLSPAEARL